MIVPDEKSGTVTTVHLMRNVNVCIQIHVNPSDADVLQFLCWACSQVKNTMWKSLLSSITTEIWFPVYMTLKKSDYGWLTNYGPVLLLQVVMGYSHSLVIARQDTDQEKEKLKKLPEYNPRTIWSDLQQQHLNLFSLEWRPAMLSWNTWPSWSLLVTVVC